jgi:hypothetical protein
MRNLKLRRGIGLVAAIALVYSLLGATGASAGMPRLALIKPETGQPYSGPSFMRIEISPAGNFCSVGYEGSNTTGKPTDTFTATSVNAEFTGCFGFHGEPSTEYFLAPSLKKLTLRWNGQAQAIGKLLITYPGPCVYDFAGMAARKEFEGPGSAFAEYSGPATGFLISKQSTVGCRQFETAGWVVQVGTLTSEEFSIFEAKVVG